MKKLFLLFFLWPSLALGQTGAGSVNPDPGSVYTYIGPSLGADWLPVSITHGSVDYQNTPWYSPDLSKAIINVVTGCGVSGVNCLAPEVTVGAAANFQKHGSYTTSTDANPALTGSLITTGGTAGSHGTGVMGIVKDAYGMTDPSGFVFYEGVRGQCDIMSTANAKAWCEGSVSEAEVAFGAPLPLTLVGHEAAINNNTGIDFPSVFDDSKIMASFLASCGDHGQEGHTAKCGMAYMVNANNAVPFNYGFFVARNPSAPGNNVSIADFASINQESLYGLELGEGHFSVAAVHLPNAGWLSFKTANGLDDVHAMTVDADNNLLIGANMPLNAVIIGENAGDATYLRTNQTTMQNSAPLAAYNNAHTSQLQLLVLDSADQLNIAPQSNVVHLVQIGNIDGSIPTKVNSTVITAPNLPVTSGVGGHVVCRNDTTKQFYVSNGAGC